jgi:hypothetical protein
MNVADWLRALGLEEYEAAFRENDVDVEVLRTLTAAEPRTSASAQFGIADAC